MIKWCLQVVFVFITVLGFAQKDEVFLNEVLRLDNRVDSILLFINKKPIYFSENLTNELNSKMPDKVVKELKKSYIESIDKENIWDVSIIKNAKGVTKHDSLGKVLNEKRRVSDSLFMSFYQLDTISNWEVIEKITDSLEALGITSNDFLNLDSKLTYTSMFSCPIISKNGKWAIIENERYVRSLHASGAIYIYKRKRNKWKLQSVVGQWVS